jgi:putative flippase GtrA
MPQVLRYLVIGAIVTGIDIGLYNLLSSRPMSFRRVPAHLISTACSMLAGFSAHFVCVFHPAEPLLVTRIVRYIVAASCSAYIIQTLTILALSYSRTPSTQLLRLAFACGLRVQSVDCMERNFVKGCAIACGVIFNFVVFKYFVYA